MESDDDINNNCFQISIINCETFITKKVTINGKKDRTTASASDKLDKNVG